MQPFEADAAVAIGRGLARLCSLIYSTGAVKCIVLDCDNTLWGGIIGEDGIAGIQIGETYPGVCFRQFQHQLLQLKQLGFLLAINSKNQEQDVRAVFERHPGMALRYDDFAAARINWDNKASNMLSLAEELNIGVDSFLFIDDNPFEVDLIRRELPAVRCLTMPADAWKIPMLLPDCGLADTLRVTSEDANRSRLYSDERQRSDLQKRCGTYDDYLASLGMTLTFECFDAEKHLSRAAQLTQKTNQFNLTTRRYTEADLRQAWENGAAIFMASLRDRFGDYGRILLAIVKRQARGIAELDTFLMSCRVIGRGVEDAVSAAGNAIRSGRVRGADRRVSADAQEWFVR
jgi:FkbH-like protein